MSTQPHDLHRALLRPAIIHTLRAAGFHTTKPSVLDTLTNLAERHLLLLAATTVQHAESSHNDPVPTITDVRMALTDAGVLIPAAGNGEEEWRERMRRPLREVGKAKAKTKEGGWHDGGRERREAERRRREEEDLRDVAEFTRWFDGAQHAEIKRVAGLVPDAASGGINVGVGGGVVHAEDFLTTLKRKHGKVGNEEARWQGTALGRAAEDKTVVIEGGPVQRLGDWRPPKQARYTGKELKAQGAEAPADEAGQDMAAEIIDNTVSTLATSTETLDSSSSTLGHEDVDMGGVSPTATTTAAATAA